MDFNSTRRQFLVGTGLTAGALTFALGVALATFTISKDVGAGFKVWQAKPYVLAWPVAACIAGLALAFVSVQPGNPLIRTSQPMRRTVAGTNLAVTTLLLLGLLALIHLLSYADPMSRFFGRSYDWTASGFNRTSVRWDMGVRLSGVSTGSTSRGGLDQPGRVSRSRPATPPRARRARPSPGRP